MLIDALDECDEHQIRDMLSFFGRLGRIATTAATQFQVCFSSRHYPHITITHGLSIILQDFILYHADKAEGAGLSQTEFLRSFPLRDWQTLSVLIRAFVSYFGLNTTLLHIVTQRRDCVICSPPASPRSWRTEANHEAFSICLTQYEAQGLNVACTMFTGASRYPDSSTFLCRCD